MLASYLQNGEHGVVMTKFAEARVQNEVSKNLTNAKKIMEWNSLKEFLNLPSWLTVTHL